LIAIDDDAGPLRDSLLRFTAVQSGTYFINARAWEPDAGPDPDILGGYQLAVDIGAPQNPLDAIDLKLTAPLHIDVYFALQNESFGGATAFRSWTQAEIDSAMAALATYSAATNLTVSQIGTNVGAEFVLFIADLDPNVLGQFHTEGGAGYGEFAYDGAGWTPQGLQQGGLGWVTLIHEIGHGLGLGHPHDNTFGPFDGEPGDEIMQGVVDPFDSYGTFLMNQGVFTTMSYNDGWASLFGQSPVAFGNQATPMALDLALLQQRYGANMSAHLEDNTYALPTANAPGTAFFAIWDAGGVDTIQAGVSGAGSTIDLRPATLLNEIGGGGFVSSHSGIRGGFTIPQGVVIENARGGNGSDTLIGNDIANLLEGEGGNDVLQGRGGNDTVLGGAGADTISGGNGDDFFVQAFDAADQLYGGVLGADSGFDTISYGGGGPAGVIVQLSGYATTNDAAHALLATFSGIEAVIGTTAGDALIGDGADNRITGGLGADWLVGGGGDDWFVQDSDSSGDRLFGGTPSADAGLQDMIDYQLATSGVTVQLSGYSTKAGGVPLATFTGIENAFGSSFNDALIGSADNNRLIGGAGADWLVGGAGDDIFVADTLGGVDRMFGGTPSADAGIDLIMYSDAGQGVIVQLAGWATLNNGSATLLATFSGIENVSGSQFNDSLIGNALDNRITNFWGADWLVGGGGDDVFVLYADANVDRVFGGTSVADAGIDTIDYSLGSGVIVQLSGYATTNDAAHTVLATFSGIENAIGSNSADALIGDASGNALEGGVGSDWLVGGAGADDFIYQILESTRDTIADFSHAQGDIIDLSPLDADLVAAGDQDFVFSLTRTPGLAGEAVAVATSATTALVSLYMDADNIADMTIAVIHDPGVALTQDDFVL
jgi:Ca2+-binding RTX toxin-like protein